MLSFSAGAVFLTLFPGNYAMLMVSSVLCGMSQGVFIPTASTYLSNHVAPVATALAAATMTVAMNAGQLLSPVLLNTASRWIFGQTTTTGVYIISAVGMTISAAAMIAWRHHSRD
jgi:MFS family permease